MLDQSDQFPDDVTVEHAVVGERVEHEWAGDARVRDVITGLLSDVLGLRVLVTSVVGKAEESRSPR